MSCSAPALPRPPALPLLLSLGVSCLSELEIPARLRRIRVATLEDYDQVLTGHSTEGRTHSLCRSICRFEMQYECV